MSRLSSEAWYQRPETLKPNDHIKVRLKKTQKKSTIEVFSIKKNLNIIVILNSICIFSNAL